MKFKFCLLLVLIIFISNVKSTEEKLSSTNVTCEACELIVSYVEQYVRENKTVVEIEAELEKVCTMLPGVWSSNCKVIVDGYIQQIINYIIAEENPSQVCTLLGVCSDQEILVMVMQPIISVEKLNAECQVCEMVTAYVEKSIDNNKTVQVIIADLEKLCSSFQSSWSQECSTFVSNYVPLIMTLITSELSPQLICQEMKLCPVPSTSPAFKPTSKETGNQLMLVPNHNEMHVVREHTKQPAAPVQDNSNACDICEMIATKILNFIPTSSNIQQIMNILEQECSYLQNPNAISKCKDMVDTYGEMMIKFINNAPNPDEVCGAVGLCSTSKINNFKKQHGIQVKF